jgi:hypothetical protein
MAGTSAGRMKPAQSVAGEKVRTLTGMGHAGGGLHGNSQSDGIAANHSRKGFEQAARSAEALPWEDSMRSEGMSEPLRRAN